MYYSCVSVVSPILLDFHSMNLGFSSRCYLSCCCWFFFPTSLGKFKLMKWVRSWRKKNETEYNLARAAFYVLWYSMTIFEVTNLFTYTWTSFFADFFFPFVFNAVVNFLILLTSKLATAILCAFIWVFIFHETNENKMKRKKITFNDF